MSTEENERTLCNVVCVCVCMFACVCSLLERKFETEKGRKTLNGRTRKQSTLRAVSVLFFFSIGSAVVLVVFIVTFRSSSSNSAPFLFTSACVPMAPVVFVQPKCAWSNHFLSSLYLLFYFKLICSFLNCLPLLCVLSLSHIETNQIHITKVLILFVKGLGLDITLVKHPTDIYRSF